MSFFQPPLAPLSSDGGVPDEDTAAAEPCLGAPEGVNKLDSREVYRDCHHALGGLGHGKNLTRSDLSSVVLENSTGGSVD